MKILLVQNSLYYPSYGGGNKSNRLLLEELTARGHECRVVTRVSETMDSERFRLFLADLASRDVHIDSTTGGLIVFELNGVEVHTETSTHRMREHLVGQMDSFQPDWVLVSTDDPFQIFVAPAVERDASRVVYLARTTLSLPFGPDQALQSKQYTETLSRVAGIVTVSEYVKNYIGTHGQIEAVSLPISLHGDGPFPNLGRFDSGFVTMVNPSGIKGISIFLELARRLPEYEFAAVPMWGTNEDDLAALEELDNVTLLPPVDDIDRLLEKSRVLLAPSLCNDAKPRIVFESMSRGVPALAADVGGVREAMLGMDYILPVRPVERYVADMDSQMVPKAVIPDQDIEPWVEALSKVLSDRGHYERLSAEGHLRSAEHLKSVTVEPFEQYLRMLGESRKTGPDPLPANRSAQLDDLSADKRALLLRKLRERKGN
jgi:glycosyltransferase involved in cell wall biosynthesis